MTTYAIILSRNTDKEFVYESVQREWPNSYLIAGEQLVFVSLAEPSTTASIADKVGMNSTNQKKGMVLQVGNYYGYESRELWEWLDKNT